MREIRARNASAARDPSSGFEWASIYRFLVWKCKISPREFPDLTLGQIGLLLDQSDGVIENVTEGEMMEALALAGFR